MCSPANKEESPRTFHWTACAEIFESESLGQDWEPEADRTGFGNAEWHLRMPLVVPLAKDCPSAQQYLQELPHELGRQCVILMQAGAVSIGLFEDGQAVHTKTIKKYVVRGSGRAQPTHLKTKGKSRYGSRLRLRNAQLLLQESAERLGDWWGLGEPIEQVYVNAPQRLWAEFQGFDLPPALTQKDSLIRIPLDLPRPTTDLLLRTYRSMEYGRIVPKT